MELAFCVFFDSFGEPAILETLLRMLFCNLVQFRKKGTRTGAEQNPQGGVPCSLCSWLLLQTVPLEDLQMALVSSFGRLEQRVGWSWTVPY